MGDNDHDTLIELKTSLQILCKKVDKIADKIDTLTESTSSKISWRSLLSLSGIVVTILGGIIGYNYYQDHVQSCSISENKISIQNNKNKIENIKETIIDIKDHK